MTFERDEASLDTLWRPFAQHALHQRPMVVVEGKGCYLKDDQGNEYLDGMSGLWCVNLGYGQERLVEAAAKQMRQLSYTPLTRPSPASLELARALVEVLPKGVEHVQFLNSGSEAVETALKLARQYARQTYPKDNRYKIIARYRGYHGWTMGALGATGQEVRKYQHEPTVPGFIHVRPPDMYRLYAGMSPSEAAKKMAQEIVEVIEFEGPESIAAFIGEPIIGGGGIFVPPDEYWPAIRQICDKYGILLIQDEVITGFGRTGKWFGCENWGVTPDIMTMAKGIVSGYIPMSATACTDRVFAAFLGELSENRHFTQISTFGGHPVSCAVALETLAMYKELGLIANSARMGERLGSGLAALKERYDTVGDVRGKGLLWGIELVEPGTRNPVASSITKQVLSEAQKRGLLIGSNASTVVGFDNVVTIAPPLIVTADQIDRVLATVDEALGAVSA